MSRATQSKSRADKKGGQSAPTPAVAHEIIPGKYTDVDWNRMLELDDGEDFIGEIVDEVVDTTLKVIYDKYIEKQLLPYTISQAKEALLMIIDWRFLACDEGKVDPASDPTWQEDEEPTAAVPDCWAQGSVPKIIIKKDEPVMEAIEEESKQDTAEDPTAEIDDSAVQLEEQPQPWLVNEDSLLATGEETAEAKDAVKEPMVIREPTPPQTKPKRKLKKHRGRLRSAGVKDMEESLEETERKLTTEERLRGTLEQDIGGAKGFNHMPKSVGSILKSENADIKSVASHADSVHATTSCQFQSGRPPGNRDVYYDDQGNVVAMSRIQPDRLPTHRIKTKYHIVDPQTEAAQARLDAMRTGRYQATKAKAQHPASDKSKLEQASVLDYRSMRSSTSAAAQDKRKQGTARSSRTNDAVTPLPPPMIESMELAPGVVVREGDRVKRGPRQLPRTVNKLPRRDDLRPVGVEPDLTISVRELLGNKSPAVRIEATPVPPINRKDVRPEIPATM